MEEIYFPIIIKSKRERIILSDTVRFEEVTQKEKVAFFNIKGIKIDANGMAVDVRTEHTPNFLCHYDGILHALNMSSHYHIKASNFFLIVPAPEIASDTILAINLIENTSTKITLGHYWDNDGFGIRVLYQPYIHGKGIFNIDNHEENLRTLLTDINKHPQKGRLRLLREKFINTLSLDIYNKFLGFIIILEILLVAGSQSSISFKFRLRFAFILSRIACIAEDVNELYNFAHNVYKTRSELVHSGHGVGTEDTIRDLENYTRLVLLHFVKEPADFEKTTLGNLTLNRLGLSKTI